MREEKPVQERDQQYYKTKNNLSVWVRVSRKVGLGRINYVENIVWPQQIGLEHWADGLVHHWAGFF